jgi:ABC-type lipoprotein release transport system permease subunit
VKLPTLLLLAAKYLLRYRRRYLFLFLALSFGFGIVTLITAVRDGMYENVYQAAQGHYAGDIIAAGYDPGALLPYHLSLEAMGAVEEAAAAAGIRPARTVKRTLFGNRGMVYHNGTAVRLKYVTGVDWEAEKAYLGSLRWTEEPGAFDDATALLSSPVAGRLGARKGDRVTLEVDTRFGQKNTGSFIVGGVIDDTTIFGYYKVFVSRGALNRLTLLDEGECGIIGIYLEKGANVERRRLLLQSALSQRFQTGPLTHDREELEKAASLPFRGVKIFLITIPVYLSEVAGLLDAMNIITYFLYAMMLVIILMSALVTYRLILRERRRELGTMRAIGFYGADLRVVLLAETAGLALASLLAGILLALLLQRLVTFVPLAWFPSFEIFLRDGKLSARYLPGTIAVNVLAVFAALILAAALPVWRASREPLPAMLGGGT